MFRELAQSAIAIAIAIAFGCSGDLQQQEDSPPIIVDSGGTRTVFSDAPSQSGLPFIVDTAVQMRIQSGPNRVFPTDAASAYRARDGRIIIADGRFAHAGDDRVLIYDSNGTHRATVGRAGDGPCEFEQPWWAYPYRGDSIAAYDYARHTIFIFAPSGRCGRQIRLPSKRTPAPRGVMGFSKGADGVFEDGSFLAYPEGVFEFNAPPGQAWYDHVLLRVSADGQRVDSLGHFPLMASGWDGAKQITTHFLPASAKNVAGSLLLYGDGKSAELTVFRADGSRRTVIKWNAARLATTDEHREILRSAIRQRSRVYDPYHETPSPERLSQELGSMLFADSLPLYSAALMDAAGNVWVRRYGTLEMSAGQNPAGDAHWDIFLANGSWAGALTLPARYLIQQVGDDFVLAIETNEDGVRGVSMLGLKRRG